MWPEQTPPTHDEIVHGIRSKVEHWERFGFGLWLLRDRRTGAMIGRGGLQHTFVAGLHEVEVAWAIVPGRWGEGLATELAHASLNAAFHTLALPTVIAFTLPTNIASLRVMEKSGFIYEREIEHAGLAHVLYRATAGEASRDGRGERDRSRVARTLTTRRRDAEADDRCRGGRS
jgi:ribosomal-protein-alanine N-acetyltransferase